MWFAPLLKWLAGFFAGPVLDDLLKGYQAKLAAGNTSERIAADLAARELAVEQREREVAVQQNIADEGRWWTAAPRAIACWAFAIFIAKCVVWDKVLGLGSTDPLTVSATTIPSCANCCEGASKPPMILEARMGADGKTDVQLDVSNGAR